MTSWHLRRTADLSTFETTVPTVYGLVGKSGDGTYSFHLGSDATGGLFYKEFGFASADEAKAAALEYVRRNESRLLNQEGFSRREEGAVMARKTYRMPSADDMRNKARQWMFHGKPEDNAINFIDYLYEERLVDGDGLDELYALVTVDYPNFDTDLDCADDFIDFFEDFSGKEASKAAALGDWRISGDDASRKFYDPSFADDDYAYAHADGSWEIVTKGGMTLVEDDGYGSLEEAMAACDEHIDLWVGASRKAELMWPNGMPVNLDLAEDEDELIKVIDYMYGVNEGEAAGWLRDNVLTEDELQKSIDYYSLRDLPASERIRIWEENYKSKYGFHKKSFVDAYGLPVEVGTVLEYLDEDMEGNGQLLDVLSVDGDKVLVEEQGDFGESYELGQDDLDYMQVVAGKTADWMNWQDTDWVEKRPGYWVKEWADGAFAQINEFTEYDGSTQYSWDVNTFDGSPLLGSGFTDTKEQAMSDAEQSYDEKKQVNLDRLDNYNGMFASKKADAGTDLEDIILKDDTSVDGENVEWRVSLGPFDENYYSIWVDGNRWHSERISGWDAEKLFREVCEMGSSEVAKAHSASRKVAEWVENEGVWVFDNGDDVTAEVWPRADGQGWFASTVDVADNVIDAQGDADWSLDKAKEVAEKMLADELKNASRKTASYSRELFEDFMDYANGHPMLSGKGDDYKRTFFKGADKALQWADQQGRLASRKVADYGRRGIYGNGFQMTDALTGEVYTYDVEFYPNELTGDIEWYMNVVGKGSQYVTTKGNLLDALREIDKVVEHVESVGFGVQASRKRAFFDSDILQLVNRFFDEMKADGIELYGDKGEFAMFAEWLRDEGRFASRKVALLGDDDLAMELAGQVRSLMNEFDESIDEAMSETKDWLDYQIWPMVKEYAELNMVRAVRKKAFSNEEADTYLEQYAKETGLSSADVVVILDFFRWLRENGKFASRKSAADRGDKLQALYQEYMSIYGHVLSQESADAIGHFLDWLYETGKKAKRASLDWKDDGVDEEYGDHWWFADYEEFDLSVSLGEDMDGAWDAYQWKILDCDMNMIVAEGSESTLEGAEEAAEEALFGEAVARRQAGAFGAGTDKIDELCDLMGPNAVLEALMRYLSEEELERAAESIATDWDYELMARHASNMTVDDVIRDVAEFGDGAEISREDAELVLELRDELPFSEAVESVTGIVLASCKVALSDDDFATCVDDTYAGCKDFIEEGYDSYSEVQSEAYSYCQSWADEMGVALSSDEEDEIVQIVMDELEHDGLVK